MMDDDGVLFRLLQKLKMRDLQNYKADKKRMINKFFSLFFFFCRISSCLKRTGNDVRESWRYQRGVFGRLDKAPQDCFVVESWFPDAQVLNFLFPSIYCRMYRYSWKFLINIQFVFPGEYGREKNEISQRKIVAREIRGKYFDIFSALIFGFFLITFLRIILSLKF